MEAKEIRENAAFAECMSGRHCFDTAVVILTDVAALKKLRKEKSTGVGSKMFYEALSTSISIMMSDAANMLLEESEASGTAYRTLLAAAISKALKAAKMEPEEW